MIVLVRHGETAPNREGRLLGRGDPPLTPHGEEQAGAIARALSRGEPARLVTSPLGRCRATAERIGEQLGLPAAVDDRLVEIDYGEWEGRRLSEITRDESRRWRADPNHAPPGGESLADLHQRVGEWCAEQADSDGAVVAVTHVSPIKAGVAWALGVGPEIAWRSFVDVASITTIGLNPRGPVLLGFNERGHLVDLAD